MYKVCRLMNIKRQGWIGVMGIAVLTGTGTTFAEDVLMYGLTNRALNGAEVVADHDLPWLNVGNLSDLGYRGVSVRLGEADSGLFFSPFTRASVADNHYMVGHAYGKVGLLNRRISTVFCRRSAFATYPVTIDLSPLGSLRKTAQVFVGDTFVGEESFTQGDIVVSTSNDSNVGPRVNPFWRAPDGSVGVLLEFSTTPPITLPSGRSTYASRIFVRADNPLFDVDYVSRVDVYGGGGLPEFTALDERIGMFGRAHRALGAAVFAARDGRLKINECADAGTDGVLIELSNNTGFTAQLKPLSLAATNSVFQFSATSAPDRYNYYSPALYLGSLRVSNDQGEQKLQVDMREMVGTVRLQAFNGSTPAGEVMAGSMAAGSFGTNELLIVSAGVISAQGTNTSALQLELRDPATLVIDGTTLHGNRFLVSLVNPTNDIGAFSSFQLLACQAPFTIMAESALAPLPSTLAIERSGTNVLVSWPGHSAGYMTLQFANDLGDIHSWYYSPFEQTPASRSRVQAIVPIALADRRFFVLQNYYAQIFNSID